MDLVVLIDSNDFVVASTSRLLKQRDVAALTDASQILKRAQARERLLFDQTLIAFEQSRQRGWRKGMAQAQAEMAQRLAQAQAARQVALHDLTPLLAEIVADAVELLVKAAPRRALIASALATVGGLLRQARWAHLRVHPSQADEARVALAEARAAFIGAEIVSVISDASVEVDGCVFETAAGIADASLSVQLAAIRVAVEQAVTAIASVAELRGQIEPVESTQAGAAASPAAVAAASASASAVTYPLGAPA